jgi:putative DNA primase/helicase
MSGTKSPHKTNWVPVCGRRIAIWPDHDDCGLKFAHKVAGLAGDAGAESIAIVNVPANFPTRWDVADPPPEGWNVERLLGLLNSAEPWVTTNHAGSPKSSIRVMGGDLADATESALHLLAAESDALNAVYVRGNLLMVPTRVRQRLNTNGIKRPMNALILRAASPDWMALRLAQRAAFHKLSENGTAYAVDPPQRLCRTVLAAAPWDLLPTLTGIIEAPTILPDGTVVDVPGYDQASGLLFDPGETNFPAIPKRPTRKQAEDALAVLQLPLKDFPFLDEARRAVALSAILTTLVRRTLRAAPLFAIDAPKMASGKTLIATVCSYVATGRGPCLMPQVADSTDERKRLLSALLESPAILVIDNIEIPLRSDSLCIAITEPSFTDRILGKSETATAPTNCCFFATGNNLVVAGDLTARTLLCKIDPRCE